MENVIGLKNFYEEINHDFNNFGYKIFYEIINTSEFGLPQNRKRLFIFGIKTKNNTNFENFKSFVKKSLNKQRILYSKKYKFNLFDAMGDLPFLKSKNVK